MEFEPIRHRLARQLHAKGVHTICHSRVIEDKPFQPVSYRLDDGTIYTPKFNVFGSFRRTTHF